MVDKLVENRGARSASEDEQWGGYQRKKNLTNDDIEVSKADVDLGLFFLNFDTLLLAIHAVCIWCINHHKIAHTPNSCSFN